MNRENLEMLAAALAGGWTPLKFDMSTFQSKCGTAACALGHTPYATGIERNFGEQCWENWVHYSDRVLGFDHYSTPEKWNFCFAPSWDSVILGNEPTAYEAASRIAWILDGGDVRRYRALCHCLKPQKRPWYNYFNRSGRTPGGWYGMSEVKEREYESE